MLKAGTVVQNTIDVKDYVAVQRSGDYNDIRSNGSYMRTGFIPKFTADIAADLVDNYRASPTRSHWFGTQQGGGAVGRVANDATAFAHRDASHNLLSFVSWEFGEDGSEHVAYIKEHWSHASPHTQGFYTNDVSTEGQAEINRNYRGNFPRLLQIKEQYDPTNLFRLNANIQKA
jgi:hypothetical protein